MHHSVKLFCSIVTPCLVVSLFFHCYSIFFFDALDYCTFILLFLQFTHRCKVWMENSQRVWKLEAETVSRKKSYYLCEKHFEKEAFNQVAVPTSRRTLRWDAVPTVFEKVDILFIIFMFIKRVNVCLNSFCRFNNRRNSVEHVGQWS